MSLTPPLPHTLGCEEITAGNQGPKQASRSWQQWKPDSAHGTWKAIQLWPLVRHLQYVLQPSVLQLVFLSALTLPGWL